MADKKISALTSLTQGDVAASTDVLPIVDTSATETKKITASALVGAGMTAGVTNVDINSGAIDGTTIGANSAAAGTFTNLTASGTVSFSGAAVSNGGTVATIDINGGTIDATSIGASSASTGSFTTLTTSSTVTLSGGTANGVAYLNGSKVLTSGSALTFSGANLGVGIASASQRLHIFESTAATGAFLQTQEVGGQNAYFGVNTSGGSIQVAGANPLQFAINGTERMRLTSSVLYTDSSINVGIGTTSPGARLGVTSPAATAAAAAFRSGSTDSVYLTLGRNAYEAGVGVTGSTVLLTGATAGDLNIYTSLAGAAIRFGTGNAGTIQATLDSSGNLGIGAASPGAKLDVRGNATFTGNATARQTADFTNTGGQLYVGAESSAGGAVFTGSSAYAGILGTNTNTALQLATNGAVRATLDASGNLGLGVTPSLWQTGAKAVEIGGSGYLAFTGSTNGGYLYSNAYLASGGNTYKATGFAAAYGLGPSGQHQWFIAPSGTINTAISFTQAMTLDASGNLALGRTSVTTLGGSYRTVDLDGENGSGFRFRSNGTTIGVLYSSGTSYLDLATTGSYPLTFTTNNTERGRFTAGGYFKASNDGTYNGSTANYHELKSTTAGLPSTFIQNTNANPYGAVINFTSSPDNNSNYFLNCEDGTTVRCYIWSDGDLANHDGVYGTISDERLKQDIVDASSQWDDLKAIRFRKYRMKTDVEANPDAPAMFGVVAQELAQVCPGLVDEHPNMKKVEVTDEEGNVTQTQEPDGTTTMTVKSSILLMKAAKALQEAMARIESLEADMAALKGAK